MATIDYAHSLKSKHSAPVFKYVLVMEKLKRDNSSKAIQAVSYGVATKVMDEALRLNSWSKAASTLRGIKKYGWTSWYYQQGKFKSALSAGNLVKFLS